MPDTISSNVIPERLSVPLIEAKVIELGPTPEKVS